jgi:predicted cobalt transporter CbtA
LALVLRKLATNRSNRIVIPGIYAAIIATAFLLMPPNPDPTTAPMDLVTYFRIASALTMVMFWGLMGLVFGSFWDKLRPHESAKISTV